jgi:hypothetical protein
MRRPRGWIEVPVFQLDQDQTVEVERSSEWFVINQEAQVRIEDEKQKHQDFRNAVRAMGMTRKSARIRRIR